MLAVWRDWAGHGARLSDAIATSLGLFAGRAAAYHQDGDLACAWLPTQRLARPLRGWNPARGASGAVVLFHGWLDNPDALASELGVPPDDAGRLYLAAVERWAEAADRRVLGSYCAVIAEADGGLRLSRSPWSAPPLAYACSSDEAVVASAPRVLFAAGVRKRLDTRKLADNLYLNLSDDEAGWYLGTRRVPQGAIVRLQRGQSRTMRWYDPLAAPDVRFARDEDYVDAAAELLTQATRFAMRAAKRPGIALSGGLDSSLVASEAVRHLGPGQRLPTFTFRPEAGFDDRLPPDLMGDEAPFVERFAAMHPALEPRYTRNDGIGFDHRWPEMFAAMGGAPHILPTFYVYHGVWQAARDAGCDVLFDATLGNQTLSNDGRWSYVEHLLHLRWRQLYLTLSRRRGDGRPLWRKLAALSLLPVLPRPVRSGIRRMVRPARSTINDLVSLARPEAVAALCLRERAGRAGMLHDYAYAASRRRSIELDYRHADFEAPEIAQAFEQVYGLRQRDVLAYRPLIEFCHGLPTDQFVRDGEERWLAKRLAVGRMPEAQRLNPRYGRHDVDWVTRLGRRRAELRDAAAAIARQPDLAELIDVARLERLVEDWPEHFSEDYETFMPREMGVPQAVMTARFVAYVEGRNER